MERDPNHDRLIDAALRAAVAATRATERLAVGLQEDTANPRQSTLDSLSACAACARHAVHDLEAALKRDRQGNPMEKNPTHVWIGVIPEIFGYGINVVAHTRSDAEAALRKAYADWKVARPNPITNFKSSFACHGGYVVKVKIGDCYHGGFRS